MDISNKFYKIVIIHLNKYENEVEIMRDIHKKCDENVFREILLSEKEEHIEDVNVQKSLSEKLRAKGNKIFSEKNNEKLIGAIRAYTQAIFVAPPGEVLALAHAQRSAALQEYGYYQQAYDDCVVAIEQGFPENLKHEVQFRQAYCAWKIGDLELLLRHLDELEQEKINNNFDEEIQLLRLKSKEMQKNAPIERTKSDQPNQHILMKDCIDITYAAAGRHLIANRAINKNDIVCIERAPSFVNIVNRGVCENCAILLCFPFPCKNCHNRVIYCSLACLREHEPIHKIECPGIRLNIFSKMGFGKLGLRILLDGLPQLLPLLQKWSNIDKLWRKLMSGTVIKSDYSYTLQMETPLKKMSLQTLAQWTSIAQVLLFYLKEKTSFFDHFENVQWNRKQKELLVASLLLRHLGQMTINGYVFKSITPVFKETNYGLLLSDIWYRPYHVKRGQLHTFSHYEGIATIICPYISIAKNGCDPSLTLRFSGRHLNAYATRALAPGDELTHAYIGSHLATRRNTRREKLRALYCIVCSCYKCNCEFPDEDYEKFRQFRCEFDNCQQIFAHESDNMIVSIFCDCGRKQTKAWLVEFNNLLELVHNEWDRRKLYNCFNNVDRWLVGFNTCKLQLAHFLIVTCFKALNAGAVFLDDEFTILSDIIRFNLEGMEKLYRANSLQYVAKMFYLWDIIALGKYKCTNDELERMVHAIEITSDEIKMICMNYCDDFIRPQLQ